MDLKASLQTATTHHKAGELEHAEQLYRSILSEQAKHPDANHNLGALLKQGDKADSALPFFKTALESNPNQGQYWISYIDTLIHLGQYDTAQNVLNQGQAKGLKGDAVDQLKRRLNSTVKPSPKSVDTPSKTLNVNATLTRAKSHANKGQLDEAKQLYQRVLEAFPQNQQAKKGLKVLQKGQVNKKNPSCPSQAQVDAVISLYSQGQVQEALSASETLIKDYPNTPLLYNISGVCYQALGQLEAAVKSYEQALAIKPDYVEAHYNLGNTLKELGQLEAAVKSYEQALAIKPDYAEAHYNLGNTLNDLGHLEAAVKRYEQALAIRPDYAEAQCNLGNTLKELGQLDAAVKSYEQALAIKPDYAEAQCNLGNTLKELGQLDAAVKSYEQALAIRPDYAETQCNLGNTLNDLGQLEAAVKRYEQALAIKPDYAEAHYNLGNTLKELGQLEAAVKSYEQALAIKPDYVEAHYNLGNTLKELGQLEAAVKSYEQALAIKPDYAEAHNNLCELYLKSNLISEFKGALTQAQKALPENEPSLLFRLAQLANHEKRLEDCRNILECISPDKLTSKLHSGYSGLLAETYDKTGFYQQAFNQFEITNRIVQQKLDTKEVNGQRYFQQVAQSLEAWSNTTNIPWAASQTIIQQHSLVFLVGFPRSGTTLLDTILRSHPEVSVIEEKMMVNAMYNHLGSSVTPELLATLNNHQRNELSNVYFKELATHLNTTIKHKIVVDKFPLNINCVGLIHCIFPDAKFILALRHPYDCVLSCFMQSFKLNDAMANFLTLEDSARLYDATMRHWNEYNRVLDLNVGQLKYEDLIQDLQTTVTPLLNFLDLEWDDNLLNYQQTALSRGTINTPSYNQVTQKLYTQANGRWKNYQGQMKEVSSWLDPWVDHFNYTEIP